MKRVKKIIKIKRKISPVRCPNCSEKYKVYNTKRGRIKGIILSNYIETSSKARAYHCYSCNYFWTVRKKRINLLHIFNIRRR